MYYNGDYSKIISSSSDFADMKDQEEQELIPVSEYNTAGPSEDKNAIPQLDGNISLLSEDETAIDQLDGNNSVPLEVEANMKKSIFSANCASNEVIQLLTFFRSFDFVWENIDWHNLCKFSSSEESCFFCHIRSSGLRLNGERGRGPKSLKINEFVSQLGKYKSFLGWDWSVNANNLPVFIRNTFSLLQIY